LPAPVKPARPSAAQTPKGVGKLTNKIAIYLTTALIAGFSVLAFNAMILGADTDDPLLAKGKLIFEETAGGIGCATCHGLDATGNPDAGSPFIRGVSKAQLDAALDGGVPDMDFIRLNRQEEKAVLAYLQHLGQVGEAPVSPEAAVEEIPPEETDAGLECPIATQPPL